VSFYNRYLYLCLSRIKQSNKYVFLDVNHPCAVTINGGCQQFCIPSENSNRVCACSVGYKKEFDIKCTPHSSFAIVSQVDLVRGYSLTDTLDAIVPISGPGK